MADEQNKNKKSARKKASDIKKAVKILSIITGSVVFLIFGIFFLVFLLILIAFIPGQRSQVGIGLPVSPTATPSASVSPSAPTPECGNIDAVLKTDLNMTIVGPSASCEVKQAIFAGVIRPLASPTYKKFYQNIGPINIIVNPPDTPGCRGYRSGRTLTLWGFLNCNRTSMHFLMIHEIGHLIRAYNFTLIANFPHSSLVLQDRNCYDQRFLKTYALRSGVLPQSESFAEATALYVFGRKISTYLASQPIYNFKQECPNTYNVMRSYLYGGYEFN